MHIVVNTRLLLPKKLDGIGWFSHEVLSRLTKDLSDWKFTFLFDRPFDQDFIYGNNVEGKILHPQTRHPLLYQWYFERTIPHKLKRMNADLFFSPDGFLSTRARIKQVPVIHDINFEHRPQDLPRAYSNYYRKYFPQFAQIADRIITVSEYSANDIHETYGIAKDKISVAYNGYNTAYRVLSDGEKAKAKTEFAQGEDYFIFVGNFSFRKNIHGIIKAFEKYSSKGGSGKLLLVGNPLWRYTEMNEALKNCAFQDDVIFTGRLEIEKLILAMGGATALLFPSYFEGFGIPIIEAFAAGVPVITSNKTSLPEIAGNAAMISDPDNIEKISDNMLEIYHDENQRLTLKNKGLQRISSFSWEHTTNKVKEALFLSLNLTK